MHCYLKRYCGASEHQLQVISYMMYLDIVIILTIWYTIMPILKPYVLLGLY
jgi:hypothetical protein